MQQTNRMLQMRLLFMGYSVSRNSYLFSSLISRECESFFYRYTNIRYFTTTCRCMYLDQKESKILQNVTEKSISIQCPECGKRFISVANLEKHRRSRHSLSLKSHSQEILEKLRKSNAELYTKVKKLQEINLSKVSSISSNSLSQSGAASSFKNETNSFFSSAVPEGKVVNISVSELSKLQEHKFRLGAGIPEIWCIGVVEGDIELGFLGNRKIEKEGEIVNGLEVLQFTLKTEGYRQRRVGQLKMYRNSLLVRIVAPQYKPQEGDVVIITGTYGIHKSYDMISKQAVENVVVEAGYLGLLHKKIKHEMRKEEKLLK